MAVENQAPADEAVEQTEQQTEQAGAPDQTFLASPGSDLDVSPEDETGDVDGSVATPEQTETVDDSGIDDDLASLASSYGLNPAAFGGSTNLRNAIAVLDRQASALVQQFQPQRDPETGRPGQQTGQQAQAAFDLKKLLQESFGGEYDEAVEKVLSGLHGHIDGRVSKAEQVLGHLPALVERVQQFDQFMQAQQERETTAELDQLFAKASDFKDTFGEGSITALVPHGPQFKARNALVEEMAALDLADSQRGRQPSTRAQLFERALRSLHGQKTETIARKQIANKLQGNRNKALARPSQKTGQPVNGTQRAVQRLNEYWAKQGQPVVDFDDE